MPNSHEKLDIYYLKNLSMLIKNNFVLLSHK